MTKEVHTLDTSRSRRKLVFTATAHNWVLVVRAHCRYVHHCGHDEIWRESANTTLLEKKSFHVIVVGTVFFCVCVFGS